ncbi:MAG: DUF4859 domain-containing protein [Prevotellaceae bacterium]|nr:DUF4859 domain-containing protein [Prevotellaceae bacterium]
MKYNLLLSLAMLSGGFASVSAQTAEEILADNTAKVAGATEDNPVLTDFVVNGTFDSTKDPWVTTTGAQNSALASNQQGAFTGKFWENWNPSNYTGKMYQVIENIPNGIYELSICAFANVFSEGAHYVYANLDKTYLTEGAPTAYTVRTVVAGNKIEIGLDQTAAVNNWMGIDNVSLTYYGDIALEEYQQIYATTKATAEGLLKEAMSLEAEGMLNAALELSVDNEDVASLAAAISALNDAVASAQTSVVHYASNKAAIDARYALLNSTNVYTTEAYDTFKAAADDYLAKWEAGELTETVVNPNSLQVWRAANDYDDFLLSAWGTKDFDTNLYINTWSTEGENDGSDFKVPFFEYWTGDGNSLDVTTKTATVVGLEADKMYSVSALVRVRIKNGVTEAPAGITLTAGDGTPVDVTKGEQIGTSQMYLMKAVANGKTDAEGNLAISFNVEEGNNISWLAFKNVNYAEYHISSNLDFAEGAPVDNGICTYAKDMAGNNTTYSQLLDVEGWAISENGDARAGGLFAYGSEQWLGGTGYNVPATNPEGEATGNALGVIGVWSASAQYTQKVTLPAGNYVLTIPVYNVGGTSATVKNLIGFIAEDGTEYLAPNKVYAVGKWTNEIVQFTLTEQTSGVLSLGFAAPGAGSGACQHLFFDKVDIKAVSNAELLLIQLKANIEAANKVVEAKVNVGDALFMIPTSALDTYAAAVAEAQTVADNAEATEEEVSAAIEALNAATEVYAATPATAPKADAEYTIKQNASGNYLTLNGGVTIEAEAAPLKFEAVGDGTYYIADADGEYVGYAGTNKWTMSATAENKAAWTIASIGDGLYTIKGMNGAIASDNTDAGSTCYGDKAADNENAAWIIEEIKSEETHMYVINVDVEREVNLGYGAQTATVDIADICEKLGLEAISGENVRGVNPDGTYVENAMAVYDGWRNAEGAFEKWGDNAYVCVKFDATVSEDNINICTFPNNEPAEGTVYTAAWAVVTETDTVVVNTNITFVAPVVIDYEIVKTITVNHNEEAGTAYSETTAEFDVAAVTEALGIESISEAEQYIVNVTDGSFVKNTTDGWRNADGDAAGWGTAGGVCVKIQEPASGTIDYIGCYDETHQAGEVYTAKWGFTYGNKAVVIDVVITFVVPVGIEGVAAENIANVQYYGVNGAVLDAPQKGLNIVKVTLTDGKVVTKKVLVK